MLALPLEMQSQTARIVVGKGLSVRETERLVKQTLENPTGKAKPSIKPDPDIQSLERQLSETVGANVSIKYGASGKGKMIIQYNSLDELDGIIEHIK
jgi:ParB family chromosome partitioning protein